MQKKTKKHGKKERKLVKLLDEEFEKEVIKIAEKGLTPEKIGLELSKKGVHPQEHNKKISAILKKKNLYVVPDLKNVSNKLEKVTKHYEKNRQDKRAKRDKERLLAKLRKLKKYYKEV